jgi:exopolysaccharide biosynthesis glucuronosyltransferase PssE
LIFVTVGAQMHFDRLIRAIDDWAEERGRTDVFAQVGPSEYHARCIETVRSLDPAAFRARAESATALVAHAGMGTIITALELGKPLLVFPRDFERRETRNDHQVATARHFAESGRVLAAFDEQELRLRLDEVESFAPSSRIGREASQELVARVRSFVAG